MANSITLKWGTLVAWRELSEKSVTIANLCFPNGRPMSIATEHLNAEQRELLCDLVDSLEPGWTIWSDWDGKRLTKREAKAYIREYGEER